MSNQKLNTCIYSKLISALFKEFSMLMPLFYVTFLFGNNDFLNLSYLVVGGMLQVILLTLFCWCLKGKYSGALCDAKAGRQFNSNYLKAIETGKSLSFLFSYETKRSSRIWVYCVIKSNLVYKLISIYVNNTYSTFDYFFYRLYFPDEDKRWPSIIVTSRGAMFHRQNRLQMIVNLWFISLLKTFTL